MRWEEGGEEERELVERRGQPSGKNDGRFVGVRGRWNGRQSAGIVS